MAALGIRRPPESIELWPDHHAAWDVWLHLQNAWSVVAGMSGSAYLGFDRGQAESVMRMHRVKKRQRRTVLDHLVIMEAAALPILNSE